MKVEKGISNPLSNIEPLVSIIIPTYNRAHIIEETLRSVISQTYKNWECIIVDDGSTDGTGKVILDFIDTESRFKYYSRPSNIKKGANSCRNIGYLKSKGDLIQWLDSDDLLSNDKLKNQVAYFLEDNNNDSVVFSNWNKFSNKIGDSNIRPPNSLLKSYNNALDFFETLGANQSYMCIHAYLIPRNLIQQSGLWNIYLSSNQDAEIMCRVLLLAKNIIFDAKSKVYYRTTSVSSVSRYDNKKKVLDKIYSWKLIHANLEAVFKKTNFLYIENAKNSIYNNCQISNNLDIIYQESEFFSKQLKQPLFSFQKLVVLKKQLLKKLNISVFKIL